MGMEELLFEHLMKGSRLLEKRCPACHNQLLKKGVTPVLFSPSSVHGNSSFESCSSVIDEENEQPWEPIEGLPFCLTCEAHVVTNEFELSFASEMLSSKSKAQKKGALLHLMDASRPSSPAKSPNRGGRIKPTLSISTESVYFNEEIVSPAEIEEKNGPTKENAEPSSHHELTNMQKVKELLIPAMQSRAVVSAIENQEPCSPLSNCTEVDQDKSNNNNSTAKSQNESIDLADDPEPELHQAVCSSLPAVVEEPTELPALFVEPTVLPALVEEPILLSAVVVEETTVQEVPSVDAKNNATFSSAQSNSLTTQTPGPTKVISPRVIDYNTRRNIATKCIAKKMMEGYSIIETACADCGMPLMEAKGTASCVVCPELAENLEKLQELSLTEQLRIKKSFDKQKLSEELMKKKEEERQAREFAQKEEEAARLKAIAEKAALEEAKAKEEREKMEKLLATLQKLEAEVEEKQIDAEATKKNEGTVAVPATPGCPGGATTHESDCTQEGFEGKAELEAEVEGRLIDAEATETIRPVVITTTSRGATTPESDVTQEGLDKKAVARIKDEEPVRDRSNQKQHLEGEGLELFNESDVMIMEKKRLGVIDVEAPWLEEMRVTAQKTLKIEQAAPACVKTEENLQDCTADFRSVRDAAFIEERQKREEERRLRQEKVLKDKAAIEKAKKERIEAAKRRVEETARAEAVLMAKLQEESEAAKSAIDYAKRLSTPMGEGKQALSYFFCSNTPEKTGNGENLEDEWEVRRKKAQASIPSRLHQGWKKTELHCQGTKCDSIPLLTFRSSSPYCIVCGGCGSGTDGIYKRVTSPVSPSRSGRRKPSTPIFPKMFEFVKVQPSVTAEPTVLPLVKKLLSEGEIAEEVKSKRSSEEKTVVVEEETVALNEHTKPMESVVFEKSHIIMGMKEPFERSTTDETLVKGGHVECTAESRHAVESKQFKNLKASEVQPTGRSASESGLSPEGVMVDFTDSQDALNVSLCQERKVHASNKSGLIGEIANSSVKVAECRQDSNTTQFQDTRESADPPLVSIPPPHERSHSVVNGFAAPRVEILELFDLNASMTGKKEIPRTPAIARPNIFGDYGDLGDFNKYKARPASKVNSAKAVRSSTDESKLPSFDSDVALAAIMNDLSQIKSKLNTTGLETDPLSGKNEIDSLIEKLSSAALAMKNT